MSKVKLIIAEGYGSQGLPRVGGTERVLDLGLKVPDTHDILGVIRTEFDKDHDGSVRVNDDLNPVVRYERINDLVGRLLTIIDATFPDPEQRKAMKTLFRDIAWDWYHDQSGQLTEAWRLDKFPNYKKAFDE